MRKLDQPDSCSNRRFGDARASYAALAIWLALSNAAAQSVPAQEPDTVRVAYAVTEDWSSGFSAELTISNDASWTIADWALSFQFAPQIDSIWNARIVSHQGPTYVVGPADASWDDGELAPREVVKIGFVAQGSARERPAGAYLNGAPIRLDGSSPAPRVVPPAVVPGKEWPRQVLAPYVDATAWPPVDLSAAAELTGVRHFRLGFVVAASPTRAVPTWGGTQSATSSYRLREINTLRAQGGDVAIAFGGATGSELALATRSVPELAAAYKAVIDAYGASNVEFDIEGAALADRDSIERRSAALATLGEWVRSERRTLDIWLTLPVSPDGLPPQALDVVRSAIGHGVDLRGVNAMAMDYGPAAVPDPDGRMGALAILAARRLEAQLRAVYARSATRARYADTWPMIGITPMIGRNDVPGEIFHTRDAHEVLAFAVDNGIGLLSFWSMNRDRACESELPAVSAACSGVSQQEYEFTRILRSFASGR
jgi:hypothetical protein